MFYQNENCGSTIRETFLFFHLISNITFIVHTL